MLPPLSQDDVAKIIHIFESCIIRMLFFYKWYAKKRKSGNNGSQLFNTKKDANDSFEQHKEKDKIFCLVAEDRRYPRLLKHIGRNVKTGIQKNKKN